MTNLIEARIHLLEFFDSSERESHFLRNAIELDRAGYPLPFKFPTRTCPADELPRVLAELHIAGFFRAAMSALDCLGALIIGIAGLKTLLIRADLSSALQALGRITPSHDPANAFQLRIAQILRDLVASAGPSGWETWGPAYRNMLVHRARRLSASKLEPRGAALHGPDGRPIVLAQAIRHLVIDPSLSDIEGLVENDSVAVLSEPAPQTLEGMFRSVLDTCNGAARVLASAWKERRANPTLIEQPEAQWKDFPNGTRSGFKGYAVGLKPLSVDAIGMAPDAGRRLRAASLLGVDFQNWKNRFR